MYVNGLRSRLNTFFGLGNTISSRYGYHDYVKWNNGEFKACT